MCCVPFHPEAASLHNTEDKINELFSLRVHFQVLPCFANLPEFMILLGYGRLLLTDLRTTSPPPVTSLSWVESTCKYLFPNVRKIAGLLYLHYESDAVVMLCRDVSSAIRTDINFNVIPSGCSLLCLYTVHCTVVYAPEESLNTIQIRSNRFPQNENQKVSNNSQGYDKISFSPL
jgi:hypothetical protein